jgi:hypothetical protein
MPRRRREIQRIHFSLTLFQSSEVAPNNLAAAGDETILLQ